MENFGKIPEDRTQVIGKYLIKNIKAVRCIATFEGDLSIFALFQTKTNEKWTIPFHERTIVLTDDCKFPILG